MTKLKALSKLGQSIWYDNIRRALIDSGEIQKLIDEGVTGVTSNPSIFEKAITGSSDYDLTIRDLAAEGRSVETIYEVLVLEDIRRTADLFKGVFDDTGGRDGYVSLEVSPTLAHDIDGTIAEARRLNAALNRPNVMIKVPATLAGVSAIRTLIGEGISVNVTLIFSLGNYKAVAEAYLGGLEILTAGGKDPGLVASVASFFISRIDSAVDNALAEIGNRDLMGKTAIASAKMAYADFAQIFSGERWQKLAGKGAHPQRLLWASTSTKNPSFPDTLYIDTLMGPDTVNTVPPATLTAFLDHGTVAQTLTADLSGARRHLSQLAASGIDLAAITAKIQAEGVAAFANSFESLMAGVREKRDRSRPVAK